MNTPPLRLNQILILALFIWGSNSAVSGQSIVVDKDHPYQGAGTGSYSFIEGLNGSDNSILINAYEGLEVKNRLYGIKPDGNAINNEIIINAQKQWFFGSSLNAIYIANGSSAVSNRLTFNEGTYTGFTYSNGIVGVNVFKGEMVDNNSLSIQDLTLSGSLVGVLAKGVSKTVVNNTVSISSGSFSRTNPLTAKTGIYAVLHESGNSTVINDNSVIIDGGTFKDEEIVSVYINRGSPRSLNNNVVIINGGTFSEERNRGTIFGIKGKSLCSSAGNGVIINGGEFLDSIDIYAVDEVSSSESNSNFIEINAKPEMDLSNVSLNGSKTQVTSSLVINQASGLKIGSTYKFQSLVLGSIKWQNEQPAVSILSDAQFKEISIAPNNGFLLEENQTISSGDSMTLVRAESGYGFSTLESLPEVADTYYLQGNIARTISGDIILSDDGNNLNFVVKDVELSEQAVLLAENRAVTAAFLNEGSDNALKALAVPDDINGFSLFATAEGVASDYDVNDDLKINGWHYAVGSHGSTSLTTGQLDAALYFETGQGSYRTFNSFNEESFRGDGEVSYYGGGLALRYRFSNDWYVDGAIRAGNLKTEMNNAVRNAQGALLGYDSDAFYWGGHVSVGRSLANESMKLDLYGRYYWTEVDGDHFSLGGDRFDFSEISSQRLRLGWRVESLNLGLYLGTAVEHEFKGDSYMSVADLKAPKESLDGTSLMGELGWKYRTSSIPLTVDLHASGWTGERSGISGRVFCSYEF